MNKIYSIFSILAASLALFFAGCNDDPGDHLEDAGESISDAAESAGDNIGDAVEDAGDEIDDAVN